MVSSSEIAVTNAPAQVFQGKTRQFPIQVKGFPRPRHYLCRLPTRLVSGQDATTLRKRETALNDNSSFPQKIRAIVYGVVLRSGGEKRSRPQVSCNARLESSQIQALVVSENGKKWLLLPIVR